ncbi:MAG: UDP-N-acetylmuramoyl-L-alanine--D-glutamate ligase [Gammaproteobacteria bacterium]|nr:UDP-N-acetylmuramoyl-L-alanine--D-glutamate ligase [Gammaproteobacteria bacterium]NIP89335.1 UDP-N-acetylmuramoyl-L-alanine--D-glutamate ligase [Gammaproteobacteria bacterium]NIR24169.1 UDP-N-acetylmuramoyl-L-alanine--D-glutamate ligase [Gammaproteobacteria bacterium]NIS05838.1 UDP-N-acetylmuramoyl-L-alanine--D-glutamate ligase [Gammaproteobacteria bacterium]NIU41077.1 UDP-N-acetylmuramoyl-L-alanine--D-glutamate ligase [Gammaproteobacteria bacterium]
MIERSTQQREQATTLVVGLGRTGLSCVRHLRGLGRRVAAVDSRVSPPELAAVSEEYPEVRVTLGGFLPEAFDDVGDIVVSPGVSLKEPALERALAERIPVCGDIELFARAVGTTPVVAITGSNGKSTVTTLVADMLRADGRRVKVGGNLGLPALSLLDGERPEVYVLELSSFQLETTDSLEPCVAALLNVSADHMDRYADVEEYARTKERIFSGRGAMVLNRDDPRVAAMARADRRVVFYTLETPEDDDFGLRHCDGREHLCAGKTPVIASDALAVAGRHNVANALAAMAVASVLGVRHASMARALEAFRGLAHRCQLIAEADGVRWYDDSKATNVGATVAAIRGLGGARRLVLIAGGDAKGADFTALEAPLREHVRLAILIGRDAARIAEVSRGVVETVRAEGMADAVGIARRAARPGDSVLLAPACASFDMYASYEARGDAFAAEVRRVLEA